MKKKQKTLRIGTINGEFGIIGLQVKCPLCGNPSQGFTEEDLYEQHENHLRKCAKFKTLCKKLGHTVEQAITMGKDIHNKKIDRRKR